jgi:hypothetical protein
VLIKKFKSVFIVVRWDRGEAKVGFTFDQQLLGDPIVIATEESYSFPLYPALSRIEACISSFQPRKAIST